MSRTVDERVVSMQFDNKKFEENVSSTMSTLDKLKQRLNLSGASKGLEDVSAAARKCDLSPLGAGIEAVKVKFSALQVMGITALANITNSAVNAGKRVVSAFTIDPIKTGLAEYETQINAVQTILANTESKGTTLKDVNNALDTLNAYADKTIYNFTEMTRNIGTFTAAGIDLDTSVNAIQGIANLAAVSGSTSQQASTAMYQLSQALASGTVKLMDWNSVVNAGMGGQVFQDALKETARVHGIAIDDMIKEEGSFRETLQNGWLSSDILTETLQKFTMTTEGLTKEQIEANRQMLRGKGYTEEQIDEIFKLGETATNAATKVKTFSQLTDTLKESAQSGWTQTWEILIGDFEEAKELWTNVSDTLGGIINAMSESRNKLLQGWADEGGRGMMLDSFKNIFDALVSVVTPIKEAFRDIFPPTTVDQLINFTKGLKDFTEKLKLSETASDNLKRTFKGVFAIFDILKKALSAVFTAIKPLFGGMTSLGGGILGVTARIGDWLVKVNDAIGKTAIFTKIAEGLASIFKYLVKVFKAALSTIGDIFGGVSDTLSGFGSAVAAGFNEAGNAVEGSLLVKILKGLWTIIKSVAKGILEVVKAIGEGIGNAFNGAGVSGLMDIINKLIAGGIGVGIIKLIGNLKEGLEGITDIKGDFLDILSSVKGCFQSFQQDLQAKTLIKIATAIAILVASIVVLSLIDSEKLYSSLIAVGALFAILIGATSAISKSISAMKGMAKIGMMMIMLSTSVLILASALKKISDLDTENLIAGLVGVLGLVAIMVSATVILSKFGKKGIKHAMQMVIFAAAIKVLASACEDIAYLSWTEMAKGLVGVAALAGVMVGTAKLINLGGNSVIKGATSMVIFAAAIKIMASVCEDLSYLSWTELVRGLTGIAGILVAVIGFAKLMGKSKGIMSIGVSLIAIAGAMKIFASAIQDISNLTWEELAKGLLGMAGALAAVTLALRLMPKNVLGMGAGLVVVAASLLILAEVLGKMSGMSWERIAKGLVALGGSMLILAVGLHAMKGTLSGSAALLVASVALAIFAPVVTKLGNLSWGTIAKGLIALAAAFAIIGVAGYVLGPVVPAILGLAGALALIGAAVALAGVGLLAFGAGLTSIAVGITSLASSIGVIVSLIGAFIKGIFVGLGEGIVAFCEIFSKGIPAIGEAVKAFILTICDVIVECVPAIVDTILKLALSLIEALSKHTPQIVNALFKFIIGIIDSLAENMPKFLQSIVNFLMKLFAGAIEALSDIDWETAIKGIGCIGLITGVMILLAGLALLAPAAAIGVLAFGALVTELSIVLAAIGAIAQIPGLDWLISEGGDFLQTVGTAIGKFIGGIVGGVAQGITSSLPQIGSDLSEFMSNATEFIEGARLIDSSVLGGVAALVGVVLAITAANVMEGIASWITGKSSITSFSADLPVLGAGLKSFSDLVAGISAENVTAAANAAKALAEMTKTIPNEGGVVAWFAGENSISKFGEELPVLGEGLKGFSDSVTGIVPENIIAAANAAKALAEMTATIPNSGGVVAWFSGENSISKFSEDIGKLGEGLKIFSAESGGIVPDNIMAAANAAKALAEMTAIIPNQGGIVAWFTGDNSISKFSEQLPSLGEGLKGFSDSVIGIVPENILAAANAAKALAEMSNIIPNQGGMVAWFTGDNSISKFADQLPILGEALKDFSTSVSGVVPENLTAASNAAKSLAEMTAIIPNSGGIVAWFTGETSIVNFASQLPALGQGLLDFSNSVAGINPENLTAASNAAKSLADLTAVIPNEGGIKAWFTGESGVAKFASELSTLGGGLLDFSTSVEGINAENITAASNAAKALAELTAVIPKEGGIKAWFTGETSIATFADKLPTLGKGMLGFSKSVEGISPENTTAAANAAKSLGEMTNTIPQNTDKIISFGTNIEKFAGKLSSFFSKMKGVTNGAISNVKEALEVVTNITGVNSGAIKDISNALDDITKSLKNLSKIPKDCTSKFKKALKDLGESGADSLVKALEQAKDDTKKAGKKAMESFIDGVEGMESKVKTACEDIAEAGAKAVSKKSSSFKDAGKDLAKGLAKGIENNSHYAESAAKSMANAAAKAVKKALKINSPSKIFMKIGSSIPEGFAMGIEKFGTMVASSVRGMSDTAVKSVSRSIANIADIVNSDIDTQPTIRPVLDLSDVRAGANDISSIFGARSSVGVLANVGVISSMMSRSQNGTNDDLISAIKDLGGKFDDLPSGDTVYIDGINYGDNGDVTDAAKTLVQAIRIERRK